MRDRTPIKVYPAGLGVVLFLSLAGVGRLQAQQPRVRLRPAWDTTFPLRLPPSLQPGGWLAPRTVAALVAARWEAGLREQLTQRRAAGFHQRLLASVGLLPPALDTTGARALVIPRPEELIAGEPGGEPTLEGLAGLANLGLDVTGHIEMKLDRLRSSRCSAIDVANPAAGCRAGFPTPTFDQQFRVRASGILADRLNLNVDFDSEREFDANNNINVWYEGLEDEVLRRVEVGTVTLRAPPSRFITAAIPSNSFGVQAEAQFGPLDVHGIVAEQKGSALRTRTFTVGETATQPVHFELRDLDFESGRFFFVVNPRALPASPAVDVLEVDPGALPDSLRVSQVRIYRLQAQTGRAEDNPNLGGINAVAIRSDSPQRVGPLTWELLIEGRDYYIDPSGLWFALSRRLGTDEFLAASYITVNGDTVGTYPSVNRGTDTLELLFEPRRGPESPTFFYEMRNVYRVGSSDVERPTIDLRISLNESERPLDGRGTYLQRLGLALSSDPSTLDEYNRVFPRQRDPNDGAPIQDLFVVFPHLEPFADAARLQGAERTDSLYRTPTYLLSTEGPASQFHLELEYEATGAGDRSSLNLGALQIREGSERLYAADRQLVRGQDYQIDYQLGQVRFLHPDSLFAGPTPVRAEFEENQLFDVAPKSIFGFTSTYHLGPQASINAIAMFQRDRSTFTRPVLGFEPEANFIGGLSTDFEFRPQGLTRALDALPLIETRVPSRVSVSGELAMSKPNPNQTGVAYVEDFQGEAALPISLLERDFQLGSAPEQGRGVPVSHLGAGGVFDPADATTLVWQNAVRSGSGEVLEFGPQDIDSSIALTGQGLQIEPVLWLSLLPDTVAGSRWIRPHTAGPRWRSITQSLGGGTGVGVDLSRTEFLEFWVLEDANRTAEQQNAYLVFDFGRVFEDAVAIAPESLRVSGSDTTYTGARFVGVGRLDTEKDTLTNVFNAISDDIGIHGDLVDSLTDASTGAELYEVPLCDLRGLGGRPAFPRGDVQATCTRRNSRMDTEDLDGDNRLDRDVGILNEDVVRYVFPVGDPRYFVRDGVTNLDDNGRGRTWRLYRIPFRTDTVQIGRPNLRKIQGLRITVVAPDQAGAAGETGLYVALARLRLLGAPWLKRAATPIVGLSGAEGEPHGEVAASVVSTENRDLNYTSPPGLGNVAERRGQNLELGIEQVNERSLRLLAADLRLGERAEAFIRFTNEADRNFLSYRQLRVWARGRGPGWLEGDLRFFIKVGRDENNFYLYSAPARTDSWEPEVVIDLAKWLELRTEVENRWLRGEPPSGAATCGGDTTAYVACDGDYLVQVRDPGVAPPNLARVSEVAVGMWRVGSATAIPQAELWVDDIRLTDAVDNMGFAAALDASLSAADLAELTVSLNSRDDHFRQLGQDPTYVTDRSARFGTVLRLNKLLPNAWGLDVPLAVQHTRSSAVPFYVERSDVRADGLPGLRRPEGRATTLELSLRRAKRGTTFLTRNLLDPLSVRLRRESAENTASLSRASIENRQAAVAYNLTPNAVTVAGSPGFLRRLVASLPSWISRSAFGRAFATSRLRVNPFRVRLATTLTNNVIERFTYRVPVVLSEDTTLLPLRGVVHAWQNTAEAELRPFQTLSFRAALVSTRDLHDYGDTTTIGRLLDGQRRDLLGRNIGFERGRALTTAFNMSPVVSTWLRPRVSFSSRFGLARDPNAPAPPRVGDDSAGVFRVPETLSNFRRRELGSAVDLGRLLRGVTGDSTRLAQLLGFMLPADVSYAVERRSTFDRATFDPNWRYQLGLGDFDAFREQDGTAAAAAAELRELTLAGGARLPLGAQVRLSYHDAQNDIFTRRGAAQNHLFQRNREWPSLALSWVYTPRWGLRQLVSNVTSQVRWLESARSSVQPAFGVALGGGDEVRTETSSSLVSPSLTLAWVGGITTTAQLSTGVTDALTAGNLTHSERFDIGGVVNFAFRPPETLVRLRNRIQTTVAFNASKVAVCLRRADADECRTVADSRRHQLDVRLDTGFSELLRGGATFSYVVTDQRQTSNKLTQIIFTIFADISLFAGQIQ